MGLFLRQDRTGTHTQTCVNDRQTFLGKYYVFQKISTSKAKKYDPEYSAKKMKNRIHFKTVEMNIIDEQKCLKLLFETEGPLNNVICAVESTNKPKSHVGIYDLEVSLEVIIYEYNHFSWFL